ncbi:MAG: hypothetical protein D6723_06515 [Acidobacteria bacterium]|nr:MAG: hypothetical protein D6723_06515 [Acidobacteriota bacterium]
MSGFMIVKRYWKMGALALSLTLGVALAGRASDCSKTSVGLTPLTELGTGTYQGKRGGLYPNGMNTPPPEHFLAGLRLAEEIEPLDANGRPDPRNGRIVLISIGMSNTTQEFSTFIELANDDPEKNPLLTIVDGAQGGMSANRIIDPDDGATGTRFWTRVDQRLRRAGVTPNQVQVAWVKEADPRPTLPFPADAEQLQSELAIIAQILKHRFPNLKLAYFSSRIYAGYATTSLNPEPFAYQSGFAVKWLIERQINGDPALNFDPLRGEVNAPWLAWGPYLWADGLRARQDGLIWECDDFREDGTHPSEKGRRKVAALLLDFFKTDPTARPWFLRSGF